MQKRVKWIFVFLLSLLIFPLNGQVMVSTITESFAASGGVSIDAEGYLYVADFGAQLSNANGQTITRVDPADGSLSTFASGFSGASGNAFDSQGNLFQSNIAGGFISKVDPSGNVSFFTSTNIIGPVGIAIDANDNVFVANCGGNTIARITPDGATSTVFATSNLLNCPNGLTIDENNNLYTCNFSDGNVLKIDPAGNVSILTSISGANNGHLTYHNGYLFVVDRGGNRIYRVNATTGQQILVAGNGACGKADGPALEATFSFPNGIKATPSGDTLYVNDAVPLCNANLNPIVIRMITGVNSLPAEERSSLVHATGNLAMGVFNDGALGAQQSPPFAGPGVTWRGVNGAFTGGPICAQLPTSNGLMGSFGISNDILNVASNYAAGFNSDGNFDQIATANLHDYGAPTPFGVDIIQKSYSNTGDDFVFIRYGYVNKSAATLSDFYMGMLIDWDLTPQAVTDLGGYAPERHLVYNYESTGANPYYYGIAALDTVSGMMTTPDPIGVNARLQSFVRISSIDTNPIGPPGDFRSWIGTGPAEIAPGDTFWTTFAILAGDDLQDIREHADMASQKAFALGWTNTVTGIEDAPISAGEIREFALEGNYPNPFNPSTSIRYQLAEIADVTLKVFNLLGQEVATLVRERQSAGAKTVSWDGRDYLGNPAASGVYIYRMTARSDAKGAFFSDSRKMVLMK